MEGADSPQIEKQNIHVPRKICSSGFLHDLFLVVREGSLADVDDVLTHLKRNGGDINSRNVFGLTPLHLATWRNHIPIVRRLLGAGADPDAKDGESGWSSLHRALHFGHFAVASILLQSGASNTLEDSKSRIPVDFLSGPVSQVVGDDNNSVSTEVYSWGSGTNYQLGTGNVHIQKLPGKIDSLYGSVIKLVSAAKFHSVAVTARGEVYTWGFGRGGRLGQPDFDIHSGQAAVITPRKVIVGLGCRRVRAVAAAKHHTVVATDSGEVFSWGSNREGQLGYTSVDNQPTPRRVSSLKSKIVAVAAANKHTAVVSESGEVFTWGCNKDGQLGYGTSNSASNYTPRIVECLKGKVFVGVSAAKYHTIALGTDGEVFTWGHRLVTPRRVVIARNLKKNGSSLLKFHRAERLHVVAVAAGMVHSTALTEDGTLFYWVSSDPDLKSQQLYSLYGKSMVSVSAGKYWTTVVTSTGDVYMWDGKIGKDKPPVATRLYGVKRATSVSVGETHLLIISCLYHPKYSPNSSNTSQKLKPILGNDLKELNEDFLFNDMDSDEELHSVRKDDENSPVPSLKDLCEKVAAECLVEPRNAIQMLEIADSLEADNLKKYCEEIVIRNLDYIFTVSAPAVAGTSLDILARIEKLLDRRSSEPWCYRRFPTHTATFPAIINSEEEDNENGFFRPRGNHKLPTGRKEEKQRIDWFLKAGEDPDHAVFKQVRVLRKKLQQIEMLELKHSNGHLLDDQQIAKLQTKSALENSLCLLGLPTETTLQKSSSASSDSKNRQRAQSSKKQRRKSKHKGEPVETLSSDRKTQVVTKVEDVRNKELVIKEVMEESSLCVQKRDALELPKGKNTPSKKKGKSGGLSMFLSGALDSAPKDIISAPPPPRSEGPAWGGVEVPKGGLSLRDIQNEQSKTKDSRITRRCKDRGVENLDDTIGRISLSSFVPSSPIPVPLARTSQMAGGEKSSSSWVASGTSPVLTRPSLRDIQMQQGKQHHNLSHSPKGSIAGFAVASGLGSPSDSACQSRWFRPEIETPSSIRSIQIEEMAMKDFKRFYSSVKLTLMRPCTLLRCLHQMPIATWTPVLHLI